MYVCVCMYVCMGVWVYVCITVCVNTSVCRYVCPAVRPLLHGGDSSAVRQELQGDVAQICSKPGAFAAVKANGAMSFRSTWTRGDARRFLFFVFVGFLEASRRPPQYMFF